MNNGLFPSPTPQIAANVVDGQAVIVLADSGEVTVLNDLGTLIWQTCDGEHSVEQIVQVIVEEYEVAYLTAERDVIEFLEQLVEMQALAMYEEPGTGNIVGT